IVALEIAEVPAVRRDDVLVHRGLTEVAADQRILLGRVAPPFPDMRFGEPDFDHRQIGGRHVPERISARHAQPLLVPMVTLRLVKTQMSAAISSARRTMASASLSESISARAAASA